MIDQVPFIQLLAEYLAGNAAEMSIKLQLGKPEAETWAKFRHASPVSGWATVEEAKATLREWFWGKESSGAVVEREAICKYLESQGAAPLADAVRAGAQHHGKQEDLDEG